MYYAPLAIRDNVLCPLAARDNILSTVGGQRLYCCRSVIVYSDHPARPDPSPLKRLQNPSKLLCHHLRRIPIRWKCLETLTTGLIPLGRCSFQAQCVPSIERARSMREAKRLQSHEHRGDEFVWVADSMPCHVDPKLDFWLKCSSLLSYLATIVCNRDWLVLCDSFCFGNPQICNREISTTESIWIS